MRGLYPPFESPDALPRRVLVFAPHPDDEIFGCGAMLALHAERGDTIRVVVVSDGTAGDPDGRAADIARVRVEESRRAALEIGLGPDPDFRFLGVADGRVGERRDLAELVFAELEDFDPGLVYGPSPQEYHPDHRAVARGLIAALVRGPERRVHFYGVNTQVSASVLYDTTRYEARQQAAVACLKSQLEYGDLLTKSAAADMARTVNVEDPDVLYISGFASVASSDLVRYEAALLGLLQVVQRSERTAAETHGWPAATAVISTWNKRDVVRENLQSLYRQTVPFASVVVVDNASTDGTAAMVAEEFPDVRLVVMPHSRYGACETFNIGFASATTPLVAILDDDITLPPRWLEQATARLLAEPASTAVVSTEVLEPGMPPEYVARSKAVGRRYMSTFRGCGSLAWREALARAGYYDERLFIYGNERDLTCRLLNLGYRVLQDPEIETFHKTPFGIQMGKRSLYYHARNAWLSMLKYAPLKDLARMPFVALKVLFRSAAHEAQGQVTDATGTIGIGRAVRETPGAPWIIAKAGLSVLANVPYCLRNRQPVSAPDFELPIR